MNEYFTFPCQPVTRNGMNYLRQSGTLAGNGQQYE